MSIADALAQIKFCEKKPSKFVEMVTYIQPYHSPLHNKPPPPLPPLSLYRLCWMGNEGQKQPLILTHSTFMLVNTHTCNSSSPCLSLYTPPPSLSLPLSLSSPCLFLSLSSPYIPLSLSSPYLPSAESYVGKGTYLKRIRYHGRGKHGIMHKYYAHYFLKLREGPAPPRKKKKKTDHKSFLTRKLIQAGPRSIPNSL